MRYWGFVACAALVALGLGCGGGVSGGASGLTPLRVSVDWVVRSATTSTGSAQSALLTLKGANPDSSDFAWRINRTDSVSASSGTYTSPMPARVGTWPLVVSFYDQPGAAGTVVGAAATTVTLSPDGTGIRSLSPQRTSSFVLTSAGASAVPIGVSPTDSALLAGGSTPFARMWDPGATVSFLAPASSGDLLFSKWLLNGTDASTSPTLSLSEGMGEFALEAVYIPPTAFYVPNFATSTDPQTGKPNVLSHWPRFPVTVGFIKNALLTDDRKARAVAGFDWWARATSGTIGYRLVDDASSADVAVAFADSGQTGWAGLTEYTITADQTMVGARITINLTYLADQANITPAAAHEFGHALGIRGHSSDPADLMGYSANVYNLSGPSVRDLNTLKADYWSLFTPSGRSVRTRAAAAVRSASIRCSLGFPQLASR